VHEGLFIFCNAVSPVLIALILHLALDFSFFTLSFFILLTYFLYLSLLDVELRGSGLHLLSHVPRPFCLSYFSDNIFGLLPSSTWTKILWFRFTVQLGL
jgi:hypothetical protein